MKMQLCKKPPAFITMITFTIIFLLFNSSCTKDKKSPDSGKTTTGSSTIVYTDVKPDSVILQIDPTSFNLNLNNDGINDFVFVRYTVTNCIDNFLGTYGVVSDLYAAPANNRNAIRNNGVNLAL
jgi:hypothetical protein